MKGDRMDRREFLGRGAAATFMIMKPSLVRGSAANSAIRIGLLGCGGRGTAVATSFANNTTARIVGLADLFQDRLDTARQHFDDIAEKKGYSGVDPSLIFRGHRAFEELANSKGIDSVHISTPDYFHPEHLAAVVAAGKHVYCEKPAAVDVAGTRRFLEIAKKAEGRLSLEVGFQIRSAPPFVELVKRIHDGQIGDIACISGHYHAGAIVLPPRGDISPLELRIRNWYWDRTLTGDIILDQNIHVIDICNWVLKSHPVKAVGSCGRRVRRDPGDCSDHYSLVFTYPDGVHLAFDSFQYGKAISEVTARFMGSKGVAESPYNGPMRILGDEPWTYAGASTNNLKDADSEKDKGFVESITSGNFHNQAAAGVESALSCMLGRMAAQRGGDVTWEELVNSNERYDAKLDLSRL
jgi:myo-inositol 2-dehydrogenase/D-chiro-inositol 1-dehydrogenase